MGRLTGGCRPAGCLNLDSLASLHQRSHPRSESIDEALRRIRQRLLRYSPRSDGSQRSDTLAARSPSQAKHVVVTSLELPSCNRCTTAQIPAKCSRRGSVVSRLTIPVPWRPESLCLPLPAPCFPQKKIPVRSAFLTCIMMRYTHAR